MKTLKSMALTLAALHFCCGNAMAQWSAAVENEVVIIGGWLFDGTGDERDENSAIVIRNGVFVEIGATVPEELSEYAQVIELGKDDTVLPGMFDLHAHYNYDLLDQGRAEEVRYTGIVFLANGVTSTWSAGEYFPGRVIDHRDQIDLGEETGPRLFASGPYMGGFRCEYNIQTADDECIGWPNDITEQEIRAEVDYWAALGVNSIEIKQATTEEARILIEQAHKHGMTTSGHLYNYAGTYDVDPRDAIPMGLDRLEHNMMLGSGGAASAELDEIIAVLLKYEVFFNANLQMYGGVNLRADLDGMIWTDEEQYFTPYPQELLQKRGPPGPESGRAEFNQRLVELRKLYAAGGADLLIIGTDEPIYTSLLPGFAYHRELMAMVYAGISAAQVLKAATMNGARALGVEDKLGSIEVGKLADLYIARGDPLEDITAARDVKLVVKDGQVYQADELLSWAKARIGPEGPNDHADWILEIRPLRE